MRYKVHDYHSAAAYFVTFVVSGRRPLLAKLVSDAVQLLPAGRIVEQSWLQLTEEYPGLGLDAFQVMPDHVHCILLMQGIEREGSFVSPGYSLSQVIKTFKGRSARAINQSLGFQGSFWQKGFIDRVVRSEAELDKFRSYILTNPLRQNLP